MKLIISLFIAFVSAAGAQAQGAAAASDTLIAKADSAYTADNFAEAETLYMQAMKVDGTSSELFYNLGNTYYRQGNLGKAILYYNRALKLDPANGDARQNLEFVNSKITDKQIDSGSYMWSVWQGTVGLFHADTWAIIVLVFVVCFFKLLLEI